MLKFTCFILTQILKILDYCWYVPMFEDSNKCCVWYVNIRKHGYLNEFCPVCSSPTELGKGCVNAPSTSSTSHYFVPATNLSIVSVLEFIRIGKHQSKKTLYWMAISRLWNRHCEMKILPIFLLINFRFSKKVSELWNVRLQMKHPIICNAEYKVFLAKKHLPLLNAQYITYITRISVQCAMQW